MPDLSDAERYVMLKGFLERLANRTTDPDESSTPRWDSGYLCALNTVQTYIDQIDKA